MTQPTRTTLISAATLPFTASQDVTTGLRYGTLDRFTPSPLNPRKSFSNIETLAESIYRATRFDAQGRVMESGVLNPCIVRSGGAGLELAAGERRYRAVALLQEGLTVEIRPATDDAPAVTEFMQVGADYPVPYTTRELDDTQMVELAFSENGHQEDLTILEKVDVILAWKAAGMQELEIARKLILTVPQVRNYERMGYGLGSEGRRMFASGKIGMRVATILAQVSGPIKQVLIRGAKDGMTASEMTKTVNASAITRDRAIFDVDASGLTIEPRLFESDLGDRFENQKLAMAAQVGKLQSKVDALPEGVWGDIVMVDGSPKILPAAYQYHGESKPGTLFTCHTATGEVGEFEGVRRVTDERAMKPRKSRAERDNDATDAEAKAHATVDGLINGNPRAGLANAAIVLMGCPRTMRDAPAAVKYAQTVVNGYPHVFVQPSPGVLTFTDRVSALNMLMQWSEGAICELITFLTCAPVKDTPYMDALLSATETKTN